MCRENGIPVTTAFHVQPENVSCHFGLQKSAFVNRRIYKFFHKHFYAYTEYIHCPTRFIAEELKKHGYKQDLRVISNGVDELYRAERGEKPERYRGKFCILSTGRLTKEKCQKLLIEAVKKSRHADEIQLFIAGQGPLLKKLVKAGEDLKNPPVIGFHPKEELVKMINYCDLYCHPSYAEIESIACVEAITCGAGARYFRQQKVGGALLRAAPRMPVQRGQQREPRAKDRLHDRTSRIPRNVAHGICGIRKTVRPGKMYRRNGKNVYRRSRGKTQIKRAAEIFPRLCHVIRIFFASVL